MEENLPVKKSSRSLIGSLLLAVVLFLVIFFGISAGQKQAQASAIYNTAQNVLLALKYFNQDQNRYPTATEFQDQNIMLSYLNVFPLPEYTNKTCSSNFQYKKNGTTDFQLAVCVPTNVNGLSAGWNIFTSQDIPQ